MKELKILAQEIRDFLIENISKTGGHLSSNLGVVELTIALYYVFDPKEVDVLFDVGHQCYTHKILTGRAKEFKNLRQFGGLSGYINREESEYDIFTRLDRKIISLRISKENERSIKLAKRLSFHYDGMIRMGTRKEDGTIYDDLLYSLTKNDFEENIEI